MALADVIQLPTDQEVETAEQSSRILAKYADADRVQLSIKIDQQTTDDLILSGQQMQLLLNILTEISQGNAVSVIPVQAQLSTQEAADLLNVSRPYLINLLEQGDIPFHKVGTHRRVFAKDVLAYKQDIDAKRDEALTELTRLSQELDMGY